MRVLVACEFSGIVRTAFERKGWEAWSCDLIASEQSGNYYQGDALELLDKNWDLLIGRERDFIQRLPRQWPTNGQTLSKIN